MWDIRKELDLVLDLVLLQVLAALFADLIREQLIILWYIGVQSASVLGQTLD